MTTRPDRISAEVSGDLFDGHHVVLGVGPGDDVFSVSVDGDLFVPADPPFDEMTGRLEAWLDLHYPANIFNGSSGDPGPLFVVAVRGALESLKARLHRDLIQCHFRGINAWDLHCRCVLDTGHDGEHRSRDHGPIRSVEQEQF